MREEMVKAGLGLITYITKYLKMKYCIPKIPKRMP